jgi:hypothetical protein
MICDSATIWPRAVSPSRMGRVSTSLRLDPHEGGHVQQALGDDIRGRTAPILVEPVAFSEGRKPERVFGWGSAVWSGVGHTVCVRSHESR